MLKGLVQAGKDLGPWKDSLRLNPFHIKPAFAASGTTGCLLRETILGHPSIPADLVP